MGLSCLTLLVCYNLVTQNNVKNSETKILSTLAHFYANIYEPPTSKLVRNYQVKSLGIKI